MNNSEGCCEPISLCLSNTQDVLEAIQSHLQTSGKGHKYTGIQPTEDQ